ARFFMTDGHYIEKFDIQRILLRRAVAVRSARTERLLDAINLDMDLNSGYDGFRVDNNVALIPMRLDLILLGTAFNWRVAGSAEAQPEKRTLLYLDREFAVSDLTVIFDDPRRPDPTVSLSAETSLRAQDEDREEYTVD